MSHPSETVTPTLYNFVTHKIHRLYGGHNAGSSASKKELSDLRQAVGQDPAKNPLAWQYVLTGDENIDFPDNYRGRGDEASYGELATYMALTLYAVHQQSEQRNMHTKDISFGYSIGQLVAKRTPSIKKRFDALLQARNFSGIVYHARSLVQLLKQEELTFDYGRFTTDLYWLQHPRHRAKVITRWSRDFAYGYTRHPANTSTNN